MKPRPVEAELFYVDVQTERRANRHNKAKVDFRYFTNTP